MSVHRVQQESKAALSRRREKLREEKRKKEKGDNKLCLGLHSYQKINLWGC